MYTDFICLPLRIKGLGSAIVQTEQNKSYPCYTSRAQTLCSISIESKMGKRGLKMSLVFDKKYNSIEYLIRYPDLYRLTLNIVCIDTCMYN